MKRRKKTSSADGSRRESSLSSSIKWLTRVGIEQEAAMIMDYFSNKFSDEEAGEGKEHLYMISAIFADSVMSNTQFDGILYPSVRSLGEEYVLQSNLNHVASYN